MMKKIVFSLLLCSSLFGLSACESKEERRTQLKAQIEDLERKRNRCVSEKQTQNLEKRINGSAYSGALGDLDAFNDAVKACNKEYNPQLVPLLEELDKLNGVK